MIIIHPLQVCYQNSPKVGSTSIFLWFYKLLYGADYHNPKKPVHSFFTYPPKGIIEIESVNLENFKKPDGYFVFTITRDSVERLVSAWRNRVMYHYELSYNPPLSKKLDKFKLRANPTLNYFVRNLEIYREISKSIKHHTDPMVYFLGYNPSIYDKIYDIKEISQLEVDLRRFWENKGISVPQFNIPHAQTGGPKIHIGHLSEESLKKLIEFYQDDYKVFSHKYTPTATIEHWQKLHKNVPKEKPAGAIKVITSQEAKKLFVRLEIFEVKQINIEPGLFYIAGIVIPQASSEKGRIIVKDAYGDIYPQWKGSPKVAMEIKDNPHALKSKFVIEDLKLTCNNIGQIFWEDFSGNRILLWELIGE